jgi:nicotinic acid phosphoribosyltransferase
MALAGFPLRKETFVFMLRKGGPFYMPVDLVDYVNGLLPKATDADYRYLAEQGLAMDPAYRAAMNDPQVEVHGLPQGAWFGDREPVLTVTGPSALASFLEPQIIWLQFRIRVATIARLAPETLKERVGVVTCEKERDIVLETLDAASVRINFDIKVDPSGYQKFIHARAKALVDLTGDPDRLMEAGMRAVSCMDQHRLALSACKDAGFKATSNVLLAKEFDLIPGGTTGHEHTQRWGSDYRAFSAVRDGYPGEVTFLLDTYSTRHSGLPTALRAMSEHPERVCSVRFDSESTMEGDYLLGVNAMREQGIEAPINLGGGFDTDVTKRFEELRDYMKWPAHLQRYMYGQFLVEPHVPLPTRGETGAVYKVSQTGSRPTMKFSDNPEKSSIPGKPVVFRLQMPGASMNHDKPMSVIGQQGEAPPEGYVLLTGQKECRPIDRKSVERFNEDRAVLSEETQEMVDELLEDRTEMIAFAVST